MVSGLLSNQMSSPKDLTEQAITDLLREMTGNDIPSFKHSLSTAAKRDSIGGKLIDTGFLTMKFVPDES